MGNSFIKSCFKGWGSNNMAVQAVGILIGICLIGFYLLWLIIKWIIGLVNKPKQLEGAAKVQVTMENGIPNFNSGSSSVRLESVNDKEAFTAQLQRVTGYDAETAAKMADAECPAVLMTGMEKGDANAMVTYLQKDGCSVISTFEQ